MSALRCVAESSSPVAVLRLGGRLDLPNSAGLRAALHKALAEQPAAVVVDLAEVTVADDLALLVLSAFARTAGQRSGCPVAVCAASPPMVAALDRLGISRAVPVRATRDEAVAALGSTPSVRREHRVLPDTPDAGALARRAVAEACHAWGCPALIDDAEMVVTELVANAVRHAGGARRLELTLSRWYLHVAVRDGSPSPPAPGGRGLTLVEALAAGWGSTPTPGGKVVWATLRRVPVGHAPSEPPTLP